MRKRERNGMREVQLSLNSPLEGTVISLRIVTAWATYEYRYVDRTTSRL